MYEQKTPRDLAGEVIGLEKKIDCFGHEETASYGGPAPKVLDSHSNSPNTTVFP